MSNPNLQKIIKLTQSQYNTLANGGTVGDFTGLNDNYLYLIQEDYEFPTTTTARKILMSTSTAGLVEWQSLTANDIPNLNASKINAGTFDTARIPNLAASKITSGTFDAARIPNLDASKITSGTFADARIASAATWNAKYTKPSGGIPASDLAESYSLSTHNHDSRYLKLTGGNLTGLIQITLNSGNSGEFKATRGNYTLWFGIGSGDVNRGIYDATNNNWMIYRDNTTNVYINGAIYENGTALSAKYLGKTAKAADADKLDGQDSTYYLNYNNLSNKPTIPTFNSLNFIATINSNNTSTYKWHRIMHLNTMDSWSDNESTYYYSARYQGGPHCIFRVEFRTNYTSVPSQPSIRILSGNMPTSDIKICMNYTRRSSDDRYEAYCDVFVKVPSWARAQLYRIGDTTTSSTVFYNSSEGTDAATRTEAYLDIEGSSAGYASYDLYQMSAYTQIGTTIAQSYPASDVAAWAKAANKPSYTLDEVSDGSTRKLANYLLKSGGTMTGKLQVNALIFGYNYTNSNNRAAFMFDKPGSNYTGIGAHAEANTIYFGACNGDGDWVDSFKQIWKFNGTIIEDGTSLVDKYLGISATAADSSKLNGQAASYYAPKAWVSDNYLGISSKAADSNKLNGQLASYYAIATHDHDSVYLKLAGGTVTGNLTINGNLTVGSESNVTIGYLYISDVFISKSDVGLQISQGSSIVYLPPASTGALATQTWVNNKGYYTKPTTGIPDSDLASTFLKTAVTKLGSRTGDITIATLKSDLGLGSAAYTDSSAYATSGHNHDGVYVKYSAAQSLTDAQKTQARSNIGAGTSSFTGYTSSNKLHTDYINNAAGWTSVTETTVTNWGFTKNAGTVTQVKIGDTAYNPSSGIISLPAYPTTLPASDVYAWAKASTKPTYTASEVGALASDAKVVLYTLQSLTNAQKITARANIGAGTSDLEIGSTATTAAAGNHTHTLSITSGGSSPTTLAADTTYTLTAGGSTLVFKTPAAGGGSAYYANQYNQYYYFSHSNSPQISSQIGLTSLTTYNYANLFFGFNSIPEDQATSLSNGHNIKTSSRSFIMDLAIASGYVSQLVFGTVGYDITKIYARTMNAFGGYDGEPGDVSKLGTLYLEANSLHGTRVVNNSRYEFAIGRRRHCFIVNSGTTFRFYANLKNDNTASITTLAGLCAALYNAGFRSATKFLIATGIYGSYTKPIVGVYTTASTSGLTIIYMNGTTQTTSSVSSATVSDSDDGVIYEP